MRKILYILMLIFLVSCNDNPVEIQEKKPTKLAPLELKKTDYDSFVLNAKTYKLPVSYEEFRSNGISIKQNEYFHQTIGKNQQLMANLAGDGYDLGVTFKNPKNTLIDTEEGMIIELYINSSLDQNQGFSINGLSFGDSFAKAIDSLKDFNTDQVAGDKQKTINYYTDKNYVSLYFDEDKFTGAAIFSKSFMRDENYVEGEFVVFGQTMKFPITIKDLEELMLTELDLGEENGSLAPSEELEVKIYSPVYENLEQVSKNGGVDFTIKNNLSYEIPTKDAFISKISAVSSPDLSVGNIYVGASIDELKKVDKKNQAPRRLDILGKNSDGKATFNFAAENNTSYVFTADEKAITKIEIINKEIQ